MRTNVGTSYRDIARCLGFSPDAHIASQTETVSAAVWRFEPGRTYELAGPPARSNVISMPVVGQFDHAYFANGRHRFSCVHAPFHLNIVCSGEQPRGIMSAPRPFAVMHVYVPQSMVEGLATDSGAVTGSGSVVLTDPGCAPDPDIEAVSRQILREMENPDRCTRLMLDGLTLALVIRLLRRHSNLAGSRVLVTEHGPKPHDHRLKWAVDYLEAHLADEVGLRDLAAAAGLSVTHLTTLFRRGTGESPHRFLMRRRFERACELLADSSLSVTDVAYRCGFSNSQHLAAVMRKRMATTPTAYRRQLWS